MIITDNQYYHTLEKYTSNHIVLTLVDSTESEYLATENKTEYKIILKLKRITNYPLHQMVKSDITSRGFQWKQL